MTHLSDAVRSEEQLLEKQGVMAGTDFKAKVDQHPVTVVGGFMAVAFVAGISVMNFFDERNKPAELAKPVEAVDINGLVQQIREVVAENVQLKIEIAQLKGQVTPQKAAEAQDKAEKVIGGISIDAINEHGILGGPNSFFRKPFG